MVTAATSTSLTLYGVNAKIATSVKETVDQRLKVLSDRSDSPTGKRPMFYFGFCAGEFSLVGGTIPLSRKYVTMFP